MYGKLKKSYKFKRLKKNCLVCGNSEMFFGGNIQKGLDVIKIYFVAFKGFSVKQSGEQLYFINRI